MKDELVLALLPTTIVLLVFVLVEALSNQKLLFSSLASSAFLIYLDPHHGTNRIRTLIISQMSAAAIGLVTFELLGPAYHSAAVSMVVVIVVMIVLDAMHPPAVATALSFAFRAEDESNLFLFALAVTMTALLVLLAKASVWILARAEGKQWRHKK